MDPCWDQALADALTVEACGAADPILFVEEREDGVVEVGGPTGGVAVRRTGACGIAASTFRDDDRMTFRSDPEPSDALALARAVCGRDPAPLPAGRPRGGAEGGRDTGFGALPIRRATAILQALANRAAESAHVAEVRARWVGFHQEIRVARRGRPTRSDVRKGGRIRLEVSGPRRHLLVASAEAVLPLELAPESRIEQLGGLPGAVTSRLARLLDARALGNGERTVVFAPGVGGVFVHEVVGHALEADTVLAGRSWLARADGCVGGEAMTVIDDPRRGRAGWKHDDEGETVRPIALLRRGVASEWLHDARSARHTGQPATGHGRRASFREPVRPRMGCTFVAAGHRQPEEVLDGIDDGVYVRRLEAGATDPRSGRATFRVTEADRIRKGKIAEPLLPHMLIADGPAALRSVDRIANDVAFDPCAGSCMRDGQPLVTSVGGPTFRLLATVVFP